MGSVGVTAVAAGGGEFAFGVQESRFEGWEFDVIVSGLRFGVQGFGCRVQGLGCRVQGLGCRVQGLGFGV